MPHMTTFFPKKKYSEGTENNKITKTRQKSPSQVPLHLVPQNSHNAVDGSTAMRHDLTKV